MLRTLAIVMISLFCACGDSDGTDAGLDGQIDAGADAPMIDAFTPDVPVDTGIDASPTDAGVDSPDAPTPDADTSDAGCECSEPDEICVDGACVMRGCGDGFRELGPSPAREGCDDGNLDDDDLCSASCVPQDFVAAVDPDEFWEAQLTLHAPSVGVDADGNALAIWSRARDGLSVHGRRFSPVGVPIGDPFEIESSRGLGTVVGLRGGGWVVAYYTDTGLTTGNDVVARVVGLDGTVGPQRILNSQRTGDQRIPLLASLGDGFVAVWFDRDVDPDGGVYARRFSATASALDAADIQIATDTADRQTNGRIASDGDTWIVTYEQSSFSGATAPSLMARRFRDASPLDATPFEVAPVESRHASVSGRSLPFDDAASGEFAVVFERDTGVGSANDIYLREIPSGPPSGFPDERLWFDGGRDFNPWIAPLPGDELIVSSELSGRDAAVTSTRTLPPEVAQLDAALLSFERNLTIAPSPIGIWLSWEATPLPAVVPMRVFLLLHD